MSDKNFLSHCNFDKIISNQFVLEHNLSKWNIKINDYKIKNNQWCITISMPYKEMDIELKEYNEDSMFFNKHVCKFFLKDTSSDTSLWLNKIITLKFSQNCKFLLFSTPFFYPHNFYFFNNHSYLYEKIQYSINYLSKFTDSYNKKFKEGIPLMYIKSTTETKYEYIINIVITSCIQITYGKSDIDKNIVHLYLMIDNSKKTTDNISKFHELQLKIPRDIDIKVGNVNFNIIVNTI